MDTSQNKKIFLTCFIGLVTTSFGFILRAITLPDWGAELNLTNTQIGEIAGVGLWPFAISIVLFSLVIDKIGYKTALIFAVICHISSAILTFFANGYILLYIATFCMALGNGAIEAAINPVVASMFCSIAAFVENGDHIVASRSLFGSTHQILTRLLPKWGISHTYVNIQNMEEWENAIQPNTKLLFVETPSNPAQDLADLAALGKLAEKHAGITAKVINEGEIAIGDQVALHKKTE